MRSFTHLITVPLALATQALSQSLPTSTVTATASGSSSSSSNSIITTPLTNPLLPTSDRPTPVSECPIIISTASVCSTCMTIDCVTVSTVTAGCTCANPPMTVYQSWGCEKGCDALPSGCKTLYEVVSEEAGKCSGGDFGNGTATVAAASSTVMSFSSGGPLGPVKPTISGPISINAAGRQAMMPFRFW
ncbi:hypothetical protein GE21DRAFT_6367 [Neurospora crassa]|uniref:Extracellular membrane protein CFEM domain-containing protein n=1 Tax=Neurospora crassa (strain ATCC 24698 / 74-OR23-1A / CBS 708.71 / DSM 1257 / FGSC 987) TaxID=367110 RepID=V5IPA0_NEUCR|nr:hypothetical protein NCU16848 [Neurospora crassa OR74A]XP_011394424.1 uncharacterized protein NCU16848 [Neurospora crassa OR74A]ESA43003.1 hypothetical protein NCU16848 [Neurospora crassa OR74A]ESA43004.1 hypothetical protein, variant [Neurospora crassa OR74A]KHE88745.1 hypothetical protein GE21DRAFT_6367 [Neurospora crassa]|eukprot:XP_011394423.1 hypothetical protein NCU16848 [Neurospora crassa OR74A]